MTEPEPGSRGRRWVPRRAARKTAPESEPATLNPAGDDRAELDALRGELAACEAILAIRVGQADELHGIITAARADRDEAVPFLRALAAPGPVRAADRRAAATAALAALGDGAGAETL